MATLRGRASCVPPPERAGASDEPGHKARSEVKAVAAETAGAGRKEVDRLRLTHGPHAEQYLVDRMQEALRGGDEEAARHYDRIMKRLQSNR